jgi:hypothetical protein
VGSKEYHKKKTREIYWADKDLSRLYNSESEPNETFTNFKRRKKRVSLT